MYPISKFDLIPLSLCLIFFFLVLLKLFKPKNNTKNLPPSPPKLPIIGNLHQLGSLPHQSLAALSDKHGPLMLLKLGQVPTLVVSSAEMAREVMKTHDLNFSSRPLSTAANILLYQSHDVAFAPYGDYWRQARKICALELFSVKRVESFQYVRDEEVAVLVDRIRRGCDGEGSVNLCELFLSTSNNIVSRCMMGDKFEDENGKSRFGDISRRAMVIITAFCFADFLPALWWIDVVRGFDGELKKCFTTLDAFLSKVVEEHMAKMRAGGESDESKKDFMDIMLQLMQGEKVDYHFSLDHLKAIDMFVGGSDTTATGLEWTMTELMRNRAAMDKVQEEVRRVVGKKARIEVEDIEKMEYMKCVIKESLRLHPPLPLLIPRETMGDVEIEGYHIPSKARVFVNVWAIQRDPKIWERPNEFIPERFMEKNSGGQKGRDEYGRDEYEFISFGGGRRKCPGMSFGLASFECALANLLHWFDWKLPNGSELDVEEENGLTVRKKIPLHLNPIPYTLSN
ncbi:cytochrome P450 71A1-like isoform X2 [Momordica charantia]|uniref:Cytochrome P450 71A1-like isoform X2 n=1 Tax=Momordica charantia TaxID=3673 RepID=A0A6J1C977_MOMCH|nr:cytochrome P450 71A1-like isoform X2 [Momordica charantia]